MSKKKGFLDSTLWKNFMKYAYGLGAAVVILGALFKIMHWPFANLMLIIGMSVEVFIFSVSAFEPLHSEIDWARVYPQLAEDFDADFNFDQENQEELTPEQALLMAEENMKQVELTPDLFASLSGSLNGLKENVSKLANIEDATVATNEYATRVREASGKVAELNSGYNNTVDAMQGLAANVSSAAGDAKAYQEQVQLVTRNLSSLNAVYEMELKDAETHIKTMNSFVGGLATAMGSMSGIAEDAEHAKSEMASLSKNLRTLNRVYGGMLSAMGGGNQD